MPTGPNGQPIPSTGGGSALPPTSGVIPGASDPSKPLPPLQPGQKVEVGRGGRLIDPTPGLTPPLPTPSTAGDIAKQFEALRKLYEGNRYVPTPRSSSELQRTADNLRELMTQQAKPGSHHLVPAGTNLYIRNYQTMPPEGVVTPLPTQANPIPSGSSGAPSNNNSAAPIKSK